MLHNSLHTLKINQVYFCKLSLIYKYQEDIQRHIGGHSAGNQIHMFGRFKGSDNHYTFHNWVHNVSTLWPEGVTHKI